MSFLAHKQPETELDEAGIWLSIGDLMSGLLMLFALLLVVSLLLINEAAEKAKNSRVVIIQALEQTLKAAGINANIDPKTGDISIADKLLFDVNESKLKPEGIVFIKNFIPVYSKALFTDSKISDQVQYVVVEGHTSRDGAWGHNLTLSLERANSVSSAINNLNFENKKPFLKKLQAAGRGEAEANQEFNDNNDRKVVFKFQFKGDEFLNWFINESGLARG